MNPCHARRGRWFGLVLSCLLSSLPASASDVDVAQIRSAFGDYREAILASDGHAAANGLSQATHAYYEHIRELALSGSSEVVQKQPVADQLQILLYRSRVPRRLLETMSSEGLIAHSVEQGWIARESVAKIETSKVDVRGNEAMVHVRTDGIEKGPAFFYRREAEGWRLDLVPVMRATEKALRNAARREDMETSDFVLAIVERAVGREIGAEAWIPLVDRADKNPSSDGEVQ